MSLLTSYKGVHQNQIVKLAIDYKSHHFGEIGKILPIFKVLYVGILENDYISSDFSALITNFGVQVQISLSNVPQKTCWK